MGLNGLAEERRELAIDNGWIGFSRAKPPAIRKVDLQNREEVVGLLDEVK